MSKDFDLPKIGRVVFTKRKASRHIRLRITHNGTPHVSMPFWLSYAVAIKFAQSKVDWIVKHKSDLSISEHQHGQRIGKTHRLVYEPASNGKLRTRVIGNEAFVYLPVNTNLNDKNVKDITEKLIVKLLKKQSESLLPQRLEYLAKSNNFSYNKVKISKMRSRWGSCSNEKLITLNCFLIQLPWELIDYVLLHELAHTKVLSHSSEFWEVLESVLPNAKAKRKQIKKYHPRIYAEAP